MATMVTIKKGDKIVFIQEFLLDKPGLIVCLNLSAGKFPSLLVLFSYAEQGGTVGVDKKQKVLSSREGLLTTNTGGGGMKGVV